MRSPADTGKNLAPAHARGRMGVIPSAVISGIVLAAAGGFYVWRKIATPPPIQSRDVVTPPAPVAPPPANAPVVSPTLPIAEKAPATPRNTPSAEPVPTPANSAAPAAAAKIESAVAPAPPIRIEHSHENATVDPGLLAAWQAYRNGDFGIAMQLYSEVLRKDAQNHNPPNRDALLGMAAIAQQRSQDAIAAEYYSQVLVLDPRDPYAHAGMFSLLGASGAEGAESRLKLLLTQRPEAAALHFALGNRYAEQSRWGDAQQAYFSACALESDNAQFAFNLAVSLDHLGQGKLAAQHYRRALQLDSTANASFDRAQTQMRLDELTPH